MSVPPLDALPAGVAVFVDGGVLLHHFTGRSEQCRRLLERCADGEIHGATSTQVALDLGRRLQLLEAASLGSPAGDRPETALSEDPDQVRRLERSRADVARLPAMRLRVEDFDFADVGVALHAQGRHGLALPQALVVAVMERLGLHHLATTSPAYGAVDALTCYRPSDVHS